MELAIGVGEGDPVIPGGLEPGPQGGPVAAVLRVAEQPDAGAVPGGRAHGLRRPVAAAVVHDQDFVGVPEPGQGVVRLGDGLADAGRLVERG